MHRSQPIDNAEDHALLVRIADGEMEAMTILYERYAPVMRGVVIAFFRSHDDADDIVHDVFVRLVDRARQYAPHIGTVRTWLSAITRNACIDRKRRHTTAIEKGPCLAADQEIVRGDAELARAIDGRRAFEATRALGPIYEQTIVDLYYSDLSCSEVAGHRDVPIGTVKSRAARALDAVRSSWTEAA
jgi:RNA polymerase sigma-70 factor, ECF subfamily